MMLFGRLADIVEKSGLEGVFETVWIVTMHLWGFGGGWFCLRCMLHSKALLETRSTFVMQVNAIPFHLLSCPSLYRICGGMRVRRQDDIISVSS